MGLPVYSVGTASVANGNQTVSFAGGAALTSTDPTTGATLAVCGAGDFLVVPGSGGGLGVIQSVTDATHVTLDVPWPGSTNAAATYKIYRQSVPFTGSAAKLAQDLLNQGSDTTPDLSRTIDNGVARVKLRIGSDGKAKISVGTTGAADASLIDGISIDPATGAFSTPNGAKLSVVGYRNRLINGNFDIWPEGTSFTIASGASRYTADGWIINNLSGASCTVTKGSAPSGFSRGPSAINIAITGASINGYVELVQRLEGDALTDLDSGIASFAFDLNATTSAGALTAQTLLLNNTALDNGTFSTVAAVNAATVPVGSGRVSNGGFTGTQTPGVKNGAEVRIRLIQNTASGNINASIGAVQLEKGGVVNNFEYRPLQQEMSLCRRYFEIVYGAIRLVTTVNGYVVVPA